MAAAKNDPRQAMINMMYLVLTALLAMNISKDVLNSFILVNEGLEKTVTGYFNKNIETYNKITQSYQENPKKTEKVYNASLEIKKQTEELYKKIEGYKKGIIKEIDKDAESLDDYEGALDNNDAASIVMITNKKGEELKEGLEKYKEFLKKYVDEKQDVLLKAIDENIDTREPKQRIKEDGKKKNDKTDVTQTWVTEKFETVPMVASITMLTKIQSDIRNTENDILNYLYNQIDAASFKFNKLQPVIIPKSNYVPKGESYSADVFLAAYDTTMPPNVYVKSGFSAKNFNPDNFKPNGYTKLKIGEDGKAKYNVSGNKEGFFRWGGVLEFIGSGKNVLRFPFESSYEVAQSSLAVSADKMNVFYIGVDNPVTISVPGASLSDLSITTTKNIKLKSVGNGKFIVRALRGNKANISVKVKDGNSLRDIGTKTFRVKILPDPIPVVNNKKGGLISKSELIASGGVIPLLENFDFDVKFTITKYEFSFVNQGDIISEVASDARFTSKILSYMKRLRPRQKLYFENIKAKGPDGINRDIGSISFRIK